MALTLPEWVIGGVATLQVALGVLVLATQAKTRVNQAFAVFMLISGCIYVVPGLILLSAWLLGVQAGSLETGLAFRFFAVFDELAALFFVAVFVGWPRVVLGRYGWLWLIVPASAFGLGVIMSWIAQGNAGIMDDVDGVLLASVFGVVPFYLAWAALRQPGARGAGMALIAASLGSWFASTIMIHPARLLEGVDQLVTGKSETPWSGVAYLFHLGLALACGSFLFIGARRYRVKGVSARGVAATIFAAALAFGLIRAWWPEMLSDYGYAIPLFIGTVAMAYIVLRFQLEGMELTIKWTVQRGTVAAVFLAVFFIVAVVAENVLTNNLGPWIGGVSAGLLLFAINPLQRLGERVANAAMPKVEDTPAYHHARKNEIYAAAYEAAMQDGELRDKERDMLATLQEHLGLRPTEARAIEKGQR